MGNGFEHSTHLAVSSFMDRDRNGGKFPFRIYVLVLHLGWIGHAIFQHNSLLELVQLCAMRHALYGSVVGFWYMMLWMR
ncbi:hypothetical protein D3C76_1768870 [compost metagenome]